MASNSPSTATSVSDVAGTSTNLPALKLLKSAPSSNTDEDWWHCICVDVEVLTGAVNCLKHQLVGAQKNVGASKSATDEV